MKHEGWHMSLNWPEAIRDFEAFLQEVGLVCKRRVEDQEAFGNKLLQYGSPNIGVRIVSDRGTWSVEIAEVVTRPDEWYDAAILRDLLVGHGEDVLSLADQIKIVETNWPALVDRFSPLHQQDTHRQIARLRKGALEKALSGVLTAFQSELPVNRQNTLHFG